MNILQNRKEDNLRARMAEMFNFSTLDTVQDIIDRSFEAGVAAENDRAFAEINGFAIQPEPVRVMDVAPGSMLQLLIKDKL